MADNIAEIVAESRAAQGLPPKITDPAVIARVASLLAAAGQAIKSAGNSTITEPTPPDIEDSAVAA